MIKIKLMNYDATEYKILEAKLQSLADKGYTCKSVDYITFFIKDNRSVNYRTAIFHVEGSTRASRKIEKEQWISKYCNSQYLHLGTIKKIHIFQSTSKNKKIREMPEKVLVNFFSKKHLLKKLFLLLLACFFSYIFVPSVFTNTNINQYTTNGSIILHYLPLPFCLTFLFRTVINFYYTLHFKKEILTTKNIVKNSVQKQKRWHAGYVYLLLTSLVLLVSAVFLDSYNQNIQPLNNTIPTLSDFGFKGDTKTYNTIHVKESLLIPYSYSYIEQSGDITKDGDVNLLSIRYYQLRDTKTTKSFVTNIINSPSAISAQKIIPMDNENTIYLAYSIKDNVADTMIITKEDKIIIISTSFDLEDSRHQQIIEQYYRL